MKKFLTVLLVIAVMFTFSFGSAFAAEQTVDYEAGKTVNVLYNVEAYADATGEYGITEDYKAKITDGLTAILDGEADENTDVLTSDDRGYNVSSTNYYAPEKAAAKTAIETAITDVKAATNAKAAADILGTLKAKLDKLVKSATAITTAINALKASTETIDFTRLDARYGTSNAYYLPGYGKILRANIKDGTHKFAVSDTEKTIGDIATNTSNTFDSYQFIVTWLMDNDYRSTAEVKTGVNALLSALVPVTTTYDDAVKAEAYALQKDVWAYEDKHSESVYADKLTVADLAGINELLGKISEFNTKYAGYGVEAINTNGLKDKLLVRVVENYFNPYYAEIAAVPEVRKLDDTKKADIIALYKKVVALDDEYTKVWTLVNKKVDNSTVVGFAGPEAAYNHYKDADTTALTNAVAKFSAIKGKDFDNSEANVAALEAARKLYDEYVANYGVYDSTKEAKILAGEHNKAAVTGYKEEAEKIDTSKVQALLNNATVKVTTKALGNKKVRVQATIDTESFRNILNAMDDGCTVSYQFYYKKAANTTYKAGKVKDVNYTTFKLTKGVKYNFQCKVVFKDADGNVVATKDYKGSTVGTRTVK